MSQDGTHSGRQEPRSSQIHSARRLAVGGAVTIVVLLVTMVTTAALVHIDSAVTASGTVTGSAGTQNIAFTVAGRVEALPVSEAQHVEQGEVLAELDDTEVRGQLTSAQHAAGEAITQAIMMQDQVDGQRTLTVDQQSRDLMGDQAEHILSGAQTALDAHFAAEDLRARQLRQDLAEADHEITSAQTSASDARDQLTSVTDQLHAAQALGPSAEAQVTVLESQRQQAEAQADQLDEAVRTAEQTRTGIQAAFDQTTADQRSTATNSLVQLNAAAQTARDNVSALELQLSQLTLTAPVSGTVFNTSVDTTDTVVTAGQVIMQIRPDAGDLTIDVRIAPDDIDQVHAGAAARVAFTGLSRVTTPQLSTIIDSVSPDLVTDEQNTPSHYLARLRIPQSEIDRLDDDVQLQPGMNAEVYVTGESRTILSYLVKPILDRLEHTFREP
ncbi:HlyD family type I secretion periplasmic adaptor subunit [Pseudoclavibacter soli]|uniref:HlyD family type I secretion periplasmic adaptor subunit n=1 Tax=Pseudoclavibacter soli TaxID=452623 RepID=UPI0003F941DB|nr:HlyD family type I secretion periplasmic adaptor subunit [Pseudoclavibacter soli]